MKQCKHYFHFYSWRLYGKAGSLAREAAVGAAGLEPLAGERPAQKCTYQLFARPTNRITCVMHMQVGT